LVVVLDHPRPYLERPDWVERLGAVVSVAHED